MKYTLIICLFFLFSCQKKNDFIYGEWELGIENGDSKISIVPNQKISWEIAGYDYLSDVPFIITENTRDRITIEGNEGDDCFKFTLEMQNINEALMCIYKCHINKNMIDEVTLAKKNGSASSSLSKPKMETIFLPKDFKGKFFVIYNSKNKKNSNTITINDNGIGFSPGKPPLKQLFNANRTFQYIGDDEKIEILNPNYYNIQGKEKDLEKSIQNNEMVIIQKGYNQSGREDWNTENGVNISEDVNIEYFEVLE